MTTERKKYGCKHCGGLIIRIDGQWEHVSTEKLHPGLPPEPKEESGDESRKEFKARAWVLLWKISDRAWRHDRDYGLPMSDDEAMADFTKLLADFAMQEAQAATRKALTEAARGWILKLCTCGHATFEARYNTDCGHSLSCPAFHLADKIPEKAAAIRAEIGKEGK